jgi:hypothetical protein
VGEGSGTKTRSACPEGKILVANVCQEPCPRGYFTFRGKCELGPCTYNTQTDTLVRCPEGTYKVSQSPV